MTNNEAIKKNRTFGYTVAIALLVLASFHIVTRHQKSYWWVFAVAMLLLVLALVKPLWLRLFRLAWDKIGHVLGIINTFILLTLFYFMILTPLSLVMRLLAKDILKLKRNKHDTYWEHSPPKTNSRMENQF